jgi:hypothetical protein
MNIYYQAVLKHRELFKGNVSVVAHSLGSLMMYDILKNMTKSEFKNTTNHFRIGSCGLENSEEVGQQSEDKNLIKLNRKNRKVNLVDKQNIVIDIEKVKIELNEDSNLFKNTIIQSEDENDSTMEHYFKNIFIPQKIYSKDKNLIALDFMIDHFFLIGSPLSLFLTVEHGVNSYLEEMEIVKDFHNIIHPMDPVAYRIEPLIMNYPETQCSFTLPHWENDGIKNIFFYHLMKILCCETKDNEEGYINHDKKIGRKRYDFMIQESPSEKTINMIGFLFSHMTYWNNPDVFYFIIKMIHCHGYNHAHHNSNKFNSNK